MANGSGLLLLIVRGGPGITVTEGARQRAVDQDGELAGGRGDGLRFPDAEREASIKAPRAVCVLPTASAARRSAAAARLADGCVRDPSRRPPEILLFGARVSHEVKCFSVGHRAMSVPISAMSLRLVCGPRPSIWVRSMPAVR